MFVIPRILALLLAFMALLPSSAARADAVLSMKAALPLINAKQWDRALAAAPAGVGRDIVLWSMLREGEGRLGDYEDFLRRRPDWPGLPMLKRKGEEAVARSETPSRVISYFGRDVPGTARGAIAYVRALLANGQVAAAETEAMRAWVELSFSVEEEEVMRALMPEALRAADVARLENLLWAGKRVEAERMLPRLGAERAALARARIALMAEAAGVDALIKAVPPRFANDPGLAYARFVWRMRKDQYDSAAELILSVAPENLGRPEAWAERRALLARWLLRQGRAAEAYRVASSHGLSAGSHYADLEFLSGFIALRKLDRPQAAMSHFTRLKAGVSTPISLSRAEYWRGRAAEALGNKAEADAAYRSAARHQTAYYGLLAAERIGVPLDPALLGGASKGDWRQAPFARSSVLEAGRLLLAAGDLTLGKRFILHLAEQQDARGRELLAAMARELRQPHLEVLIAKQAAERGQILPEAYFPVPSFVPDGLPVSRALALSIARRESEFDPQARSHANAQGLMQVLPETAQRMAKTMGLEYTSGRLLRDPAFNVQVGSAYLAKMVGEFGPSVALIASGYNAGPGRPRRWINELGDPRRPEVDVVDWVEMIPFAETRTYVMRVSEALVIYRAKLKGVAGPVRLTPELKG